MIKYIWIIILVIAHIIGFIYVAHDFRETYNYYVKSEELNIVEFLDALNPNTKAIICIGAVIWFFVSLFIFLVSLFAKYQ